MLPELPIFQKYRIAHFVYEVSQIVIVDQLIFKILWRLIVARPDKTCLSDISSLKAMRWYRQCKLLQMLSWGVTQLVTLSTITNQNPQGLPSLLSVAFPYSLTWFQTGRFFGSMFSICLCSSVFFRKLTQLYLFNIECGREEGRLDWIRQMENTAMNMLLGGKPNSL